MIVSNDDGLASMDICACGDYRRQHDKHDGKCWCGKCSKFRIHKKAVHVVVEETLVYK